MNLKELWVRIRASDMTGGAIRSVEGRLSKLTSAVTRMRGMIAGAFAGGAVLGARKLISDFGEAEQATVRLSSALQNTGRFSEEAVQQITAGARAVQRLTQHGDDAVKDATATLALLAQELGAKDLTDAQRALVGIADTFLKGDIEASAQLVGKTIGSTTNALTRYGITLDTSATQQEKLQQIMEQSAPMFQVSVDKTDTLAGASLQLGEALGDVREGFGGVIALSLDYTDRTKEATDASLDFADSIEENQETIVRWGRTAVATIVWVGKTISGIVRLAFNFGQILGDGFAGVLATINAFVISMVNGVIKGINWVIRQADNIPGLDLGGVALPQMPGADAMRREAEGRALAVEGHLRDMADAVTNSAAALQSIAVAATSTPDRRPLRGGPDIPDPKDDDDDAADPLKALQEEVKLLEQGHKLRLLTRQELERAVTLEERISAQLAAGVDDLGQRLALQSAQATLGPIAAFGRLAGAGMPTTRTGALARSVSRLNPDGSERLLLGGTVRLSADEQQRFRERQGFSESDWRADAVAYAEDVTADAERAKFAVVDNFAYMAEAAITGSDQMSRAVVGGITNILQNLPGVGGFAGSIIGAVGSIVGGLFGGGRDRTVPVRVEDYSARAAAVHRESKGPERVILQVVSPTTGETIRETEYELRRRTRRDAISRVPTGVRFP